MHDIDVAIVGAGPAGAAAAIESVRQGKKTIIIEKKRLPRHKVCSGLLIPSSMEFIKTHFGTPPVDVFAKPDRYKCMRMHFKSRRCIDIPLDGWNVWRHRFDKWLCDISEANILEKTTLISFSEDTEGVTLRCRNSSNDFVIVRCQALIAADGGTSMVSSTLDPVGRSNLQWHLAVQDVYECRCDLEAGYWHYFADPDISGYPSAYIKDDLLIMDVGLKLGENALPHIERFKTYLNQCFGFSKEKLVRRHGCRLTFAAPQGWFNFGTDRILITGEASGLFNRFGEGISSALTSGIMAGQSASQGINEKQPPGTLYRKVIEKERLKTLRDFSLKTMLSDVRLKYALCNLPLLKRPLIIKDMLHWAFFIDQMRKGGLPNKPQ